MKRKTEAVVFCVIGFLLLCGFTSVTPVADFISKLFTHLPFAGFYAAVAQNFYEEIIGVTVDLPDITVNSQFLDCTKTLLTTVLKAVFFFIGCKFLLVPERLMSAKQKSEYGNFLSLPHVKDEDILNVNSLRSSYMMDFMKSGKYTFFHALLSVVVMVIAIVLAELLMLPVTGLVNELDSKTAGTVVYLLLFIAVFVISTTLFALVTKRSWGVSSLLVAVFHLMPEIITVLVTNTLAFAAFTSLCSNNTAINWMFIPILIIMVAWIIISEWLIDKIGSFLTLSSNKKRLQFAKDAKKALGIIYWILEFITSGISILLIYIMCITNYSDSQDFLSEVMNGLPFVSQLAKGERIADLFHMDRISDFIIMVMLLFLLCIVSILVHHSPIKYVSISVVGWPLLEGLIMVLVLGGYALLMAIPRLFSLGSMALDVFSWLIIYILALIVLFLFVVYKPLFFGSLIQAALLTGLFLLLQQFGVVLNVNDNFELVLFSAIGIIIVGGIINFADSLVSIIHKVSKGVSKN